MAAQTIKVSTKVNGETRVVSVVKDFGSDLAELIERYGEDVVYGRALSQMCTDLGNGVRGVISNEEISDEQAQASADSYAEEYIPGRRVRAVTAPVKSLEQQIEEAIASGDMAKLEAFQQAIAARMAQV